MINIKQGSLVEHLRAAQGMSSEQIEEGLFTSRLDDGKKALVLLSSSDEAKLAQGIKDTKSLFRTWFIGPAENSTAKKNHPISKYQVEFMDDLDVMKAILASSIKTMEAKGFSGKLMLNRSGEGVWKVGDIEVSKANNVGFGS